MKALIQSICIRLHGNCRILLSRLCLIACVVISQCKPIPKTSLFLINKTGQNVQLVDNKNFRMENLVDGVEIEFGQDLILKINSNFYLYRIPFSSDFTSVLDNEPKMGMPNYVIINSSCHLLFASDLSSVSDMVKLALSQPAPFPLMPHPKNTIEETKKELEMVRPKREPRP